MQFKKEEGKKQQKKHNKKNKTTLLISVRPYLRKVSLQTPALCASSFTTCQRIPLFNI